MISRRFSKGDSRWLDRQFILDSSFNSPPPPNRLGDCSNCVEFKILASLVMAPIVRAQKGIHSDTKKRAHDFDLKCPGFTFTKVLKSYGKDGKYLLLAVGHFRIFLGRASALEAICSRNISQKHAFSIFSGSDDTQNPRHGKFAVDISQGLMVFSHVFCLLLSSKPDERKKKTGFSWLSGRWATPRKPQFVTSQLLEKIEQANDISK